MWRSGAHVPSVDAALPERVARIAAFFLRSVTRGGVRPGPARGERGGEPRGAYADVSSEDEDAAGRPCGDRIGRWRVGVGAGPEGRCGHGETAADGKVPASNRSDNPCWPGRSEEVSCPNVQSSVALAYRGKQRAGRLHGPTERIRPRSANLGDHQSGGTCHDLRWVESACATLTATKQRGKIPGLMNSKNQINTIGYE